MVILALNYADFGPKGNIYNITFWETDSKRAVRIQKYLKWIIMTDFSNKQET